jgi:hypothetical protein
LKGIVESKYMSNTSGEFGIAHENKIAMSFETIFFLLIFKFFFNFCSVTMENYEKSAIK